MTTDPNPDISTNLPAASVAPISPSLAETPTTAQVRFKTEGGRLLLLLPPEVDTPSAATWSDLHQQLRQRLNASDRFWKEGTSVHLIARDRLLDTRQLQAIADALSEAGLTLKRIYTSRRQTAVAAATIGYSVEQLSPVTPLTPPTSESNPLADPLYVQTTVRSGMEIRHPGSVVVLGDVNPGGSVVADGDVLVWGYLRGIAQAGASGNQHCLVMALRMEPTQVRIANYVARVPAPDPDAYHPEIAYVAPEGIRIARAADFSKMRLHSRSS